MQQGQEALPSPSFVHLAVTYQQGGQRVLVFDATEAQEGHTCTHALNSITCPSHIFPLCFVMSFYSWGKY